LAAGLPGLAEGQDATDLEKLKTTVRSMEQTIQELKSRIADLEKQPKAVSGRSPAAPSAPAVPGVPPSTHPGADVMPKAQPPADDLADGTTQIPFQDTVSEDNRGARVREMPRSIRVTRVFMQLFGTKTWIRLGGLCQSRCHHRFHQGR